MKASPVDHQIHGGIAQLAEQETHKLLVAGSTPAPATNEGLFAVFLAGVDRSIRAVRRLCSER